MELLRSCVTACFPPDVIECCVMVVTVVKPSRKCGIASIMCNASGVICNVQCCRKFAKAPYAWSFCGMQVPEGRQIKTAACTVLLRCKAVGAVLMTVTGGFGFQSESSEPSYSGTFGSSFSISSPVLPPTELDHLPLNN